jgi:hypothetical protein
MGSVVHTSQVKRLGRPAIACGRTQYHLGWPWIGDGTTQLNGDDDGRIGRAAEHDTLEP